MRFSEAMLLGLPEITFRNDCWLEDVWDAGGKGMRCMGCLVGAALYSTGLRRQEHQRSIWEYLKPMWPWVTKVAREDLVCPWCYDGSVVFTDFMTHLAGHYSGAIAAERIADVVRRLEDKYDTGGRDETERKVVGGEQKVAAVAGALLHNR
jgi:hypothetical protein